jgi:ABC-type multidrug transport system fused ATPase/permease subunit
MTVVDDPAPARARRESLRPIFGLLGPHERLMKWAIVHGLFSEGLMVAGAAVSAYLVGRAVSGDVTVAEQLPWVALLAVIVPLVVLFEMLESYYAHKMSFYSHDDIRQNLYDAFERLAPAYFVRRRSGDVAAAATADVELIELYTSHHLPTRVVATVIPGLAAVGLLALHPALFGALLPFLVVIATVPRWLRTRADAQGHEILDRSGVLAADLVDAVQGVREIVTFGAQDVQLARIDRNSDALAAVRVAHGRRAGFEKATTHVLVSLGLLAVVSTAAWLVSAGALPGAAYPPAVVLAAAAFVPLAKVTGVGRELNRVAAAGERIISLLREKPVVVEAPEARHRAGLGPDIRFDAVSFRYAPDLPEVLHKVSFEVPAGRTVALVGPSGAGKSTCAHLLLRLWDAGAGQVCIGGADVRTLPLAQLPELVAFVPQDVYLFHGDVLANIRVGRPDATDAEVRWAAGVAQATEFIEALPRGYRTELGERGTRLSGGQRQRLAIARAVLSGAPILVLDEAVSSLDTESEAAIHEAIAGLGGERTILVIAHRPATIRTADHIVVLDAGRVVDAGGYAELLAAGGPFAALMRRGLDTLD